jgi:hypothetical protein
MSNFGIKIEFAKAHPAVAAWLLDEAKQSDFAASLLNAVNKYGNLTPRQLAAAERSVERKANLASDKRTAPTINVEPIVKAFESATKSGLKRPKLRFDGFEASLAPKTGKNPGAIYLKGERKIKKHGPVVWGSQAPTSEDVYFGKIADSKFLASAACTPEDKAKIEATLADPLAAAVAYGKRYGSCSCCGITLTDPVSVERGIGPICAERFNL